MGTTTGSVDTSPSPISSTSILSLLAALALLILAYTTSLHLLPTTSTRKQRVLFIWHLFDALIHFLFEGSFLYHCFFSHVSLDGSDATGAAAASQYIFTPRDVYFLGKRDKVYGSMFSGAPTAKLWQEYGKADKRWAGADLGVISLELLTVFGAGPIASYVCVLLKRAPIACFFCFWCTRGNRHAGMVWFWGSVLATAELYGGEFSVLALGSFSLPPLEWEVSILICLCVARFHDFRAGVVDREPESGYEQFHVSMGVLGLLQYLVGMVSSVGAVRSIQQYSRSFLKQ